MIRQAGSGRGAGGVVGLTVMVFALAAHAAPPARVEAGLPRAMLLPSAVQGRGAGKVEEWDAHIEARLVALGVVVVPTRPDDDELHCLQTDCLERIRQRRGFDLVMRARIDAEPLGVKVRLLTVRAGEARNSADRAECAECSIDTAARHLDELIARALGATPGESETRAPAAGADVGEIRPLVVPEGQAVLPRSAGLVAADVVLGVVIAGGLVTVGFGARYLADDGRPACTLVSPAAQCARIYDTAGIGAALVTTGAVLAVGAAIGIVALEVRHGRSRARRVAVMPTVGPGGAGLALSGRF